MKTKSAQEQNAALMFLAYIAQGGLLTFQQERWCIAHIGCQITQMGAANCVLSEAKRTISLKSSQKPHTSALFVILFLKKHNWHRRWCLLSTEISHICPRIQLHSFVSFARIGTIIFSIIVSKSMTNGYESNIDNHNKWENKSLVTLHKVQSNSLCHRCSTLWCSNLTMIYYAILRKMVVSSLNTFLHL